MRKTSDFFDELALCVETKIFDAARTDAGLPKVGPRGHTCLNLPTIQNPNEAYGYNEINIPNWLKTEITGKNPIDEYDMVQSWLRSIEAPPSKIVWARARAEARSNDERVTWARTAQPFNISTRHAQRLYRQGIDKIVKNITFGKTPIPINLRFKVYEW